MDGERIVNAEIVSVGNLIVVELYSEQLARRGTAHSIDEAYSMLHQWLAEAQQEGSR